MSPERDDDYEPDAERVQRASKARQHERTAIVEDTVDDVPGLLEEEKYPTTGEELALEYADETIDLPNETESLGSVFDRLVGERFESPAEAREAVLNELTGEASTMDEANDERPLEPFEGSETDRMD